MTRLIYVVFCVVLLQLLHSLFIPLELSDINPQHGLWEEIACE